MIFKLSCEMEGADLTRRFNPFRGSCDQSLQGTYISIKNNTHSTYYKLPVTRRDCSQYDSLNFFLLVRLHLHPSIALNIHVLRTIAARSRSQVRPNPV